MADKPVRQPVQKPVRQPVQKPVRQPVQTPVTEPVQKPVTGPVQTPMQPPVRPSVPLDDLPAQHFVLENYSSLKRYWDLLEGCAKHLEVRLPRRAPLEDCRREIHGFKRPKAGAFLDDGVLSAWLLRQGRTKAMEMDEADPDGLDPSAIGLEPSTPEALHLATCLLEGNKGPLVATLDSAYTLCWVFSLVFTKSRQLGLKVQTSFEPSGEAMPLPADWPLRARRLGKSEYRVLLERLARGPLP